MVHGSSWLARTPYGPAQLAVHASAAPLGSRPAVAEAELSTGPGHGRRASPLAPQPQLGAGTSARPCSASDHWPGHGGAGDQPVVAEDDLAAGAHSWNTAAGTACRPGQFITVVDRAG